MAVNTGRARASEHADVRGRSQQRRESGSTEKLQVLFAPSTPSATLRGPQAIRAGVSSGVPGLAGDAEATARVRRNSRCCLPEAAAEDRGLQRRPLGRHLYFDPRGTAAPCSRPTGKDGAAHPAQYRILLAS